MAALYTDTIQKPAKHQTIFAAKLRSRSRLNVTRTLPARTVLLR